MSLRRRKVDIWYEEGRQRRQRGEQMLSWDSAGGTGELRRKRPSDVCLPEKGNDLPEVKLKSSGSAAGAEDGD